MLDNLPIEQTEVKHQLVRIIREIWRKQAKRYIDNAILEEQGEKLCASLLSELAYVKTCVPHVFAEITSRWQKLDKLDEDELAEEIIKNPKLFDHDLLDDLSNNGYCLSFTRVCLVCNAVPKLKKWLLNTLKLITGYNDGSILTDENLKAIEQFCSMIRFHQRLSTYLEDKTDQIASTQIIIGEKIKTPQEIFSVGFYATYEELSHICEHIIYHDIMFDIGLRSTTKDSGHSVGFYKDPQNGKTSVFNYNGGRKKFTNFAEWLKEVFAECNYGTRIPVRITASCFAPEVIPGYLEKIDLTSLLKKTSPDLLIKFQGQEITLFTFVILFGLKTSVQYFLENHKEKIVDICQKYNISPLRLAVIHSQHKIAKLFLLYVTDPELKHIFDPNYVEPIGKTTPLMEAARMGDCDMLEDLYNHGAILEKFDQNGNTALQYAMLENRIFAIIFLLQKNPYLVIMPNIQGESAADFARSLPNEEIRQLVLQNAFIASVAEGDIHAMKHHYSCGIDVDGRDVCGYSALERAIENENEDAVKFLASRHANLNAVNNNTQETPLCFAARMQSWQVMSYLLAKKCNLSCVLHSAAKTPNNVTILTMLLLRGADIEGKNSEGLTALEVASSQKYYNHNNIAFLQAVVNCRFYFYRAMEAFKNPTRNSAFYKTGFVMDIKKAEAECPWYFRRLLKTVSDTVEDAFFKIKVQQEVGLPGKNRGEKFAFGYGLAM